MSAEPNMVPSDTTQSCSRIDETKAPLHLSLTSLRPGTSDSVIPSVEFFSQPLINNNNATTQVSKLSTNQGGIVSDDSWSECSEFTRDDDDLSVSSVSDMEDSTFEALKTGVSDDGVEGAMELDDVSLFEPLDFRV
eukprot:CAMPEP_0113600256 /NCGR_PEP_ID=MMETSP0015_2-20120614/42607_1 /TAXON_ID=2838 /ORGANISM="Odontella" /LENGTH=135 /DNA_ID=CAMNT_0000508495 /DNA_START=164 /DNA_END=567 /DNA_ORIENTATION=+ /assembly_acc=CAM_ASM_000160